MSSPLHERKAPLLTTSWRRFWTARNNLANEQGASLVQKAIELILLSGVTHITTYTFQT